VLDDRTDPARLTDEQLRRQLVYLGQLKGEAPLYGTSPDVAHRAKLRLRQLNIEHRRRIAVISL